MISCGDIIDELLLTTRVGNVAGTQMTEAAGQATRKCMYFSLYLLYVSIHARKDSEIIIVVLGKAATDILSYKPAK